MVLRVANLVTTSYRARRERVLLIPVSRCRVFRGLLSARLLSASILGFWINGRVIRWISIEGKCLSGSCLNDVYRSGM